MPATRGLTSQDTSARPLRTNLEHNKGDAVQLTRGAILASIGREVKMKGLNETINQETGAIGYVLLWLMGVPASVLFLVFLLRGCT